MFDFSIVNVSLTCCTLCYDPVVKCKEYKELNSDWIVIVTWPFGVGFLPKVLCKKSKLIFLSLIYFIVQQVETGKLLSLYFSFVQVPNQTIVKKAWEVNQEGI